MKLLKKALCTFLAVIMVLTAVPLDGLLEYAYASDEEYGELVARVAEYCSTTDADDLTAFLNSVDFDLSNADDYNKFVELYNQAGATYKERWDLQWLTTNEIFTAHHFRDHISKPHNRIGLGLSGLVYNNEAIGYITGKWVEKDKYKDALKKFMEVNYEEHLNTTVIDACVKTLEETASRIADPLKRKHVETLKKSVCKCYTSENVKTLLYEFYYEGDATMKEFTHFKNNQLAEALGIAGDVVQIADFTVEGFCNLLNVSSNLEVYKSYEGFLDEVANDRSLPVALRCAASELGEDLAGQYAQAITVIGQSAMEFATDKGISLAVDQFGSAVVADVLLVVSIGKFLGNILLGIDDIINASAYVECYAILAEKYSAMLINDRDRFNSTPSYANAVKFRDDYKILSGLRLLGEQTYLDMQGGMGVGPANSILRSMNGYEEKNSYCSSNIKQLEASRFSMSDDLPMTSLETRQSYTQTVVVACPVNVSVYDSTNKLVAKVTENIVDESVIDSAEYPVVVYVEDDVKTIKLTDLNNYRIEIEAFDAGEMTYSAYTYDESHELVKMAEFAPIVIESGDSFSVNPQGQNEVSYQDLFDENEEKLKAERIYEKEELPETQDNIVDVVVAEELFDGFPKDVVERVANTMFSMESVVDLSDYDISTDDAVALFSAVSKYYPVEYSLIANSDFTYKIIVSPNLDRIMKIRFYYGDDANLSTYQKRVKDLNAEIETLVKKVEGMSDFEKALYIHDYIVLNCEYDLELLDILETTGRLTGELRSERYTEYSVLVNGTGVCGSYALAYRAVLNAAGMDCLYLSSTQMDHAWNLVKIDGSWYHVDCCWDDPTPDTYGRARRTYFLRTDSEIMSLNHYAWSPGQYKATSTKYSDMPRGYDITQKYDDGKWYYIKGTTLCSSDEYGKNESEITSMSASSIDADNGNIYYASGRYVYEYDVYDNSSDVVYMLSTADSGSNISGAYISNIYVDAENIEYYKSVYNSDNKRVTLFDADALQKEKFASITGVKVNKSSVAVSVFNKIQIQAELISTESVEGLVVDWSISDKNIATIDDNGVIFAKNVGTVTVTASFGNFCDTCEVEVKGSGLSGIIGEKLMWKFDPETKTMLLSGDNSIPSLSPYVETIWKNLHEEIRTVNFGDEVTTIEDFAFEDFSSIETLYISDNIIDIGNFAFNGCTNIKTIYIGKGLTENDMYAFFYLNKVAEFIVDPQNEDYLSEDGVLFNKDKTILIKYTPAHTRSTYVVPEGIEKIADCAFANSVFVESVSLPDSLIEIEDKAFHSCYKMRRIYIPKNVESIEDYVFHCCVDVLDPSAECGLEFIEVDPENENYYNDEYGVLYCNDFTYRSGLTAARGEGKAIIQYPAASICKSFYIPDDIVTIAPSAFSHASHLNYVNIPEGVKIIADSAFWDCRSLKTVCIPKSVKSIEADSFATESKDPQYAKQIIIKNSDSYMKGGLSSSGNSVDPSSTIYSFGNERVYKYAVDNDINFVDIYNSEHSEHVYFLMDYTESAEDVDGYEYWECYCGNDSYSVTIHNYSEAFDIAPTCVAEGAKIEVCVNCGDEKILETTPSSEGHDYQLVSTTPGDCVTAPVMNYKCADCEATTTKTGKIDDGHKYVEVIVAPTCTEKGYTTATCEVCQETVIYDFTSPVGHDLTIKKSGSYCSAHDAIEYSCKKCDYSEVVAADIENLETKTVVVDATCTKAGSKSEICVLCDATVSVEIIRALSHDYSDDFTVDVDATCTETGSKSKHCTRCDSVREITEIPAKGHIDENHNGACDNCNGNLIGDCSCNCHKSGFMGFIWKILNFFYKLFGTNRSCACGVYHY